MKIRNLNVSARIADFANVAILVLVAVVGVRLVGSPANRSEIPGYKLGDIVQGVPRSAYATSERTLLLQSRSTCPACGPALPFYSKLIAQIHAEQLGVRVVGVSVEDLAGSKAYLEANGISTDAVFQPASADTKLAVTPALLLIDSNGRVLGNWVGVLTTQKQLEVWRALGIRKDIS